MKLPDLTPTGEVRSLPSAKAAELPSKLRAIDAGVRVGKGIGNMLQKAAESEARLDAERRINAAKRNYTQKSAELLQSYHSDRNKSLDTFAMELDSAREEALATATQDAGLMARGYVEKAADDFRTQIAPGEMKAVQELTRSRTIMHLTDIARDNLALVTETGDIDTALSSYQRTLDATTLDAETKQSEMQKFTTTSAKTAVAYWSDQGDIASLTEFVATDTFKRMSLQDQSNIEAQITNSTADIMSKDVTLAGERVAVGAWSLEQGWDFIDGTVDEFTTLSPAQRDSTKEELHLQLGAQYINGLLAAGEDQQVLNILKSGKYSGQLPADKIPGWINAANAGARAGQTANATMLNYQLDNEIAKAKDGAPFDPGALTAAEAMLPTLSESAQARTLIQINELKAYDKYRDLVITAPTTPSELLVAEDARLADEEAALRASGSANYEADLGAVQGARNGIQAQMAARQKAPVDYAIDNDQQTRTSWRAFQEDYVQFAAGAVPIEKVQASYAQYRGNVLRAQSLYMIRDPKTIPETPTALSFALETVTKGDRRQQLAAIASLNQVMGDDVRDAVTALLPNDPTGAFLLAFGTINDQVGQEAMVNGRALRESGETTTGKSTIPTMGQFMDALDARSVELPQKAIPHNLAKGALDAVYTYALGIAKDSEIQTGEFTQQTLETARDQVIGVPVSINTVGDPTFTYRDTNNTLVSAQAVRAQFYRLQTQPDWAADAVGTPMIRSGEDGALESRDWNDILTYATPIMVGNGVYELNLPKSSPLGSSGFVLDADGQRFRVNMRGLPVPDVQDIQSMRVLQRKFEAL